MRRSARISANKFALWHACFGDGEGEVSAFYALPEVKCYSVVTKDGLAAMAHILPVRAGQARGGYIYAVGVDEKCRRKGHFRRLMHRLEAEGYDFLCLIPTSEPLAATYRRYGYDMTAPRYGKAHEADSTPILPSEEFSAWAGEPQQDFSLDHGLVKRLCHICPTSMHFGSPMGEG